MCGILICGEPELKLACLKIIAINGPAPVLGMFLPHPCVRRERVREDNMQAFC